MKNSLKIKILIAGFIVILGTILIWQFFHSTNIHITKEGKMEFTPVEIEKIRNIGEWEFLSISDEEIVDTIRHGFFGDDELSRIYYGTLRLGINLSEIKEDWITMDNDTVVVKLPPVKLLDNNFLDEARTKSFIEDGKWTEEDRAALTDRAIRLMRKRCLTKQNISKAENNAKHQMTMLLNSMGMKNVRIIDKGTAQNQI